MQESEASAFLARVRDEIHPVVFHSTVPLMRERTGVPTQADILGSAVLVRLGGRKLLVTAAHVFAADVPIYVPNQSGIAVGLRGRRVVPIEAGRLDLAFVELPQDLATALEEVGFSFLNEGHLGTVDTDALPGGGYVLYGYPGDAQPIGPSGVEPLPHYLGCPPYTGSTDEMFLYEEGTHGLLSVNIHEVIDQRTRDATGFPNPQGMSGGPVWLAYRDEQIPNWDVNQARLVGFISRLYVHRHVVQITPLRILMDMIGRT
jgi:hypothetical protein